MRKNEDMVVKFGAYFGNDAGAYLTGMGATDVYGYPKASWVFTDYNTHKLFVIGEGLDNDFLMHNDYIYIERPLQGYGNEANSLDTFWACPANWGHSNYVPSLLDTDKKKWHVIKVDRSVNDNIHWGDAVMLYNKHFSGMTLIPT